MSHVLERLPSGAHVTVIRLRSLGDCVLTTPALYLLKQHRPDLAVSIVAEPRFAPIFQGNPDVDSILPPEAFAVAHENASLCLNLHGGTRSMMLTGVSMARHRAGFDHHRQAWLYNVRIPRAQEILGVERAVHTAEHLASAMFYLGVPRTEIPRARLFPPKSGGPPSPHAVIHPFAALPEKAWTTEGFLAVARHLQLDHHLEPVFIGSADDDLTPFQEYRCLRGAPLEEVMSLLASASLFVGNDSGPAHMAAAFGVPVLVLYGTSDPVVWAPWRTSSEVIVEPQGIARVPRRRVIEALDRLRVRA
jgi:ADP-heptose:LPS heptosyltransferase